MKRKHITTLLLILSLISFNQCTIKKYNLKLQKRASIRQYNHGLEQYYDHEYDKALNNFKKLVQKYPNHANFNFFYGITMMALNMPRTEIRPHMETAVKNTITNYNEKFDQAKSPVFSYYYLAQIYLSLQKYDEAINNAYIFKKNIPESNKSLIEEVDHFIRTCYVSQALNNNPITDFSIQKMENINTTFAEFAAYLSQDEKRIYFSSRRRFNDDSKQSMDGQYQSDIFFMDKIDGKWSNPIRFDIACEEKSNDNFCCLSPDENYLFFSSDRNMEQYDLYYCLKKVDGSWSTPRKLSDNINSLLSDETYVYLSNDWKTIYVVSNRRDSYGGRDIYYANKTNDGDWGELVNMGELINTSYDEKAPFISEDGKHFYFSSKGHDNMGGFDIFCSKQDSNRWLKPVNIGAPINTTFDDHYFFDKKGKFTIYSSAKKGLDNIFDIYYILNYSENKIAQNIEVINQVNYKEIEPKQNKILAQDNPIRYTIMLGTSNNEKPSDFNILYGVRNCIVQNGLKLLTIGEFTNKEEAELIKEEIITEGFLSATVIEYNIKNCKCY